MLIHLTGKVQNDQIIFPLPDINFSTKQAVRISQVLIEWATPIDNVCGSISSSLIDCSVYNPNQILCLFSQSTTSDHLLVTPPSDISYNIQLWSFQQSTFKIDVSEKQQIKRIQIFLKISNGF